MKTMMLTFSIATVLFSLNVAFAEGEAAGTYKTYCQSCHGADGSRVPAKDVPLIKGQSSAELLTMLKGYKDGSFGGPKKQVMEGIVKRLSDDQMKGLAEYIPTL